MISYNGNTNNIFSCFPQYTLGEVFDENKAVIKENIQISEEKNDEFVNIKKNKDSKKRKILFGSTIASIILTASILSLIFLKGLHGSTLNRKFLNFKNKLSHDINELSHNDTIKDFPTRVSFFLKKCMKKSMDAMEAVSNFTTFKDYGSTKVMKTNKVTGAFADGTTSGFKKIVDKTLGKKYTKVDVQVHDLTSLLKEYDIKKLKALSPEQQAQKISINGKTLTLAQWVNELEVYANKVDNVFSSNFSVGARKLRDKKRTQLLEDLPNKIHDRFFKDKKSLFNISNYKTYATEDLAKQAQNELKSDILNAKNQLCNNFESIIDNAKTSTNLFSSKIKSNDSFSITTIEKIKKQLSILKKQGNPQNEKILKDINNSIDDIIKNISSNNIYKNSDLNSMKNLLEEIRKNILTSGSSNGALDEIASILTGLNKEKIISNSCLKGFNKTGNKIALGLKKATELEMGEYFLKQAELKVGSAPTDVLSVLIPVVGGAYSIGKADNKEEKISATLTTCIPLVGTFATFVYGTVKMFSGAKNLVFSLVSGAILSYVGNSADKLYKKYKSSGSIKEVVKEECQKIQTSIEPQIDKFDENKSIKTKKA